GAHAAGLPFRLGSRLADGFTLGHDSELVIRFRKAGLQLIGTTPTPEFGFCVTSEALLHGPGRNPWRLDCSPGGSSGGAAAAVAAGLGPIAQGSDGGGSIRVPASFCGVFGLKTAAGRVPRHPSNDYWAGSSAARPLARTVRD